MSKNLLTLVTDNYSEQLTLPNWVNKNNSSFKAYLAINKQKKIKLEYIHNHKLPKFYKLKKSHQITISEIANLIDVSVPTLSATCNYSSSLMAHLKTINTSLINEKNMVLERYNFSKTKGNKHKKKDALVDELHKVNLELADLKTKNALIQAEKVLSEISLPIKRLLGIDC